MNAGHRLRVRAGLIGLTALAASLTGCVPQTPSVGPPPVLSSGSPAPMPAPGTCHLGSKNGQPMPDPVCTPGSTNPEVTQATIGSTICKSGWSSSVRPPSSVTSRMKRQSAASYSYTGTGEYDHLISLELGGAVADPANLWVEPGRIPNVKDPVENSLHSAVCKGKVTLAAAQHAIATDWPTTLSDLGL